MCPHDSLVINSCRVLTCRQNGSHTAQNISGQCKLHVRLVGLQSLQGAHCNVMRMLSAALLRSAQVAAC